MDGLLEADAAQFCLRIMEKLDVEDIKSANIKEILVDLCTYYDFSYGFMYFESDYKKTLSGQVLSIDESQAEVMPDKLELDDDLERDLLSLLSEEKMVTSTLGEPQTEFKQRLEALLGLECYILVSVTDEDKRVIAMIGLGDRKKIKRLEDINLASAYSIFVIILNHIKVWSYQESIERTEKALASIANNMGVDIYVNDFDNHDILYVNESMAAPYGGVAAAIGKKCWKSWYDDKTGPCEYCPQKKLIDQEGKPTKIYSWDYMRPFDKSWFRVLSAVFRWEGGRMARIASSIDITEHKQKEELIRIIAEYDTLTRLFNRRKLFGDGEMMLRKADETGAEFFVLFFDLIKFKQVNDIYGHRAGDELLGLIGVYLQVCELTKDRAYRYGGDEFVILLPEHTREEVVRVAEELQRQFSKPWKLKSGDAVCRASIGIARYPADGDDMDQLLKSADEAMYEAKRMEGKKIVFYGE